MSTPFQNFDAIVAGAGIWGCTVARRLADAGRKVLVLEKRAAVGGNCRCEIDSETGIEVHTYGSHIFHTDSEKVWKFINRFTKFNDYRHCVLARTKKVGGKSRATADGFHLYHLPIGKTLLEEFFGVSMADKNLSDFLSQPSILNPQLSTLNPQPSTTRTRRDDLFDAFIRGYTSKQWGVPPEKVNPSIIARLKVRDSHSTDYFDDRYQGIPSDGYNAMFKRMLDHPNIAVQCGCELFLEEGKAKVKGEGEQWINQLLFNQTIKQSNNQTILYSGPIDALFNYKYGALPWRTLRFERETLPVADYQGNSVVNYPDVDIPYTRIHEFAHYHPESNGILISAIHNSSFILHNSARTRTVVMREYSAAWQLGDEPYYPIATPESAALLARYQNEVDLFNQAIKQSSNQTHLQIGGRLGQYQYLDMDKAIESALKVNLG